MRILLTGATGYIGQRLIPVLLNSGHELWCTVRDPSRFIIPAQYSDRIHVLKVDFLNDHIEIPEDLDLDAAYYLIHSMKGSQDAFDTEEAKAANNFKNLAKKAGIKQVIYLSGIVNDEKLSKHLQSRKNVEEILMSGRFHTTVLRAGIIIGSGSASFEIIRDLVEKLPFMITPRWVLTKSQPIAVRNVLQCLEGVLMKEECFDEGYDIAGPDLLTYKQMMLAYAEVRNLPRYILTVPVLSPRLSSYWLFFVTAISYNLAVNLVNSMKVEIISKDDRLMKMLDIQPISYKEAIRMAFDKIEQNMVVSSWTDAFNDSGIDHSLQQYIEVPEHGCMKDLRTENVMSKDKDRVMKRFLAIGGTTGWYYANFLWQLRGWIDKVFGGVGLRRGRKNSEELKPGDALDFWRVITVDPKEGRLLLYAEMILPGEAWLEFKLIPSNEAYILRQTATFRPWGLLGRLYWLSTTPFHFFIFRGMLRNIVYGK